MAYALIVLEFPGVNTVEGLDSVLTTGLKFQSDVRCSSGPIEHIGLQAQLLGVSRYSHEQSYYEQPQSVCYVFSHITFFFKCSSFVMLLC